ncbi:MAG: hypothetical protein L0216_04705 [Planctomycetales bacterium]|nr:hypothetical protein [Planctomycetales bacterium]
MRRLTFLAIVGACLGAACRSERPPAPAAGDGSAPPATADAQKPKGPDGPPDAPKPPDVPGASAIAAEGKVPLILDERGLLWRGGTGTSAPLTEPELKKLSRESAAGGKPASAVLLAHGDAPPAVIRKMIEAAAASGFEDVALAFYGQGFGGLAPGDAGGPPAAPPVPPLPPGAPVPPVPHGDPGPRDAGPPGSGR